MVIVVEIEDRCLVKPFLGGWRNVVTGTEYHDACTQTCPRDKVVYSRGRKQHKDDLAAASASASASAAGASGGGGGGGSSDTRGLNVITETRDECVGTDMSVMMLVLAPHRSKSTSVIRERATQTSRLPDLSDKLLTPLAPKVEAFSWTKNENKGTLICEFTKVDEYREKRSDENERENFFSLEEDSAVKIQKCYRAHRARMEIGALARLSRETRAQTPPEPEEVDHSRRSRTSQFEIVNLSQPQKRSDFEMVNNVLERWRFYENSRIEDSFFGTSKLAARATMLKREIELLRSIETIKRRVRGERRQRRNLENLDKLAQPEIWKVANGKKYIFVETLRVQRARECRDFYRSLFNENLSSIERIEILKKLRKYSAEHTCKYSQDLISLIDQEIQLLRINDNDEIMEFLRNRMKLALLRLTINFCSPKEKFNKEKKTVDNFQSMKKLKSSCSKLCKRCGKLLSIDDLSARLVSQNSQLLFTCNKCQKIQPGKESKIVYEPYEIMLRDLRLREVDLGSSSSDGNLAWKVDSRIIYRLVNYIWHGKSGISGCDDLYRLYLVRYRTDDQWSPWNNLVLTKREAVLHQSMDDPKKNYAPTIMKQFIVKNLQAKLRFDLFTRINFSLSNKNK